MKCIALYVKLKISVGAGEVAQMLSMYAVLKEDLGLLPAPTWWLISIYNSLRECNAF